VPSDPHSNVFCHKPGAPGTLFGLRDKKALGVGPGAGKDCMESIQQAFTGEQDYLSPEHRKMLLEESGISPDVVAARGYRTVEDSEELSQLGFADYQCRVPGLLIPIRGTSEEVVFHRYRPDRPREGRKYEQPEGTSLVLDVPLPAQKYLRDVTRRLWVCEGEKKADALVSRGEVALSILGVWSWKKNDLLLPQWDDVSTVGREILIAFDADAADKNQVHLARQTLAEILLRRSGSTVVGRGRG
jgi:putative DNA primase/helicase